MKLASRLLVPQRLGLLLFTGMQLAFGIERTREIPLGLPPFAADSLFTGFRVAYGGFLFQSPALSRDRKISCASCHLEAHALADTQAVSTGVFGRRGERNSPALQNLYRRETLMRDGRADLAGQPRLPLEAPAEMDVPWTRALRELAAREETAAYLRAAGRAALSRNDVLQSLSAYLRSLVSGNSRFDRYRYGGEGSALTPREKRGLALFTGEAQCSACHPLGASFATFSHEAFHALGVGADPGRERITRNAADRGDFQTPSLRNVTRTAPYMHDGSLATLGEVLRFYNRGGGLSGPASDPMIFPLHLTEEELSDLEAFLGSLESPVLQYFP